MHNIRIQKEFKLATTNESCSHFKIIPEEENMRLWNISFKGHESTPYKDGIFDVIVIFTDEYPFVAPVVSFVTKIYHPNVSSKGEVCLGTLKKWTQSLTIKDVLIELYELLLCPNIADPMMPDIASMYQNNINMFNQKARDWVMLYAQK